MIPPNPWNGLWIPTVLHTGREMLDFTWNSWILQESHDFYVIPLKNAYFILIIVKYQLTSHGVQNSSNSLSIFGFFDVTSRKSCKRIIFSEVHEISQNLVEFLENHGNMHILAFLL